MQLAHEAGSAPASGQDAKIMGPFLPSSWEIQTNCLVEHTSLAATPIVPNTSIENTISIGPNQYTARAPMIQPTRGQANALMNGTLPLLLKWSATRRPEA